MKSKIDILIDSGCFDFVSNMAEHALKELERARPACFSLLTDEARDGLRKNCAVRLEQLYVQALAKELQERTTERDPVSAMLGRADPALEARIAEEMAQSAHADMEALLHERYPLAADYETHILRNFQSSWIEFFDALTTCRDEITERLLGGRPFTKIERFSDIGGDQHRRGRAVTGVWTDGGVFYYKPHDCGLDAMYRKIVERWFSDCTVAAEVVQKNDVAFVSQLRPAPVNTESGISDFYYRFGALTALLHGLGSIDMHMENIMACGDRPSVIDIETLISPSYSKQARNKQLEPSAHALGQSVYRIGILPVRMYGKPLLSPLYSENKGTACLPVFGGKTYTVAGHEDRFLAGFGDGYDRVLAHREEIKALLRECGGATVRCLMRNTVFYALIRRSLYRPDALQSREEREKILHRLSLPFEQMGAEVFREEVEHEAACLRMGDIPYFCTTVDGTDLCGDDPRQVVKADYFSASPLDMTEKSLDRLSEVERRYEEDIIRIAFAHAPLDAPGKMAVQPIAEASAELEKARSMAVSLFHSLQADAIHSPEGEKLWLSTTVTLHGVRPCGTMAANAEAGSFCAALLCTKALTETYGEAMEMARECVQSIAKEIMGIAESERETLVSEPQLPLGLYNGYGGILWGLAAMAKADVPQAHETAEQLLRLLAGNAELWHPDPSAAEGLAGLMLGLDALPAASTERDVCTRLCAERLMTAEVPAIPDAPKGAAGIAMALAAAYGLLGDIRFAEKASAILSQVQEAYDDALCGWPDSAVKLRWMADRGHQAAGIALAADYAAKRLPEPGTAEALRKRALLSLLDEKELGRFDTMDQGNALTVLCFLRTGQTKRAGQVLEAMRQRAEREGGYIVVPAGIRSFFDPALWLGSLGVGFAAAEYLRALSQEGERS